MKRSFAATTATLAFACLTTAASAVNAANIVETADVSGTFNTFLATAKAAGMIDTLKNSGPYTVFAPSDSAFKKLPPGMVQDLLQDQKKARELLAHLVIPGKVAVADVKPGEVKTIQGDTIKLTSDNGLVTVGNASVIQSDLMADNGIIHEIDTVVMPDK